MRFKFKTFERLSSDGCTGPEAEYEPPSSPPNLHEEYANAFRTKSYSLFWARVNAVKSNDTTKTALTPSTSAGNRLPSYRLFAEQLLEPGQKTAFEILSLSKNRPKTHCLLGDYFSKTAVASFQCSLLLKEIEQTRLQYGTLKSAIQTLIRDPVLKPTVNSPKPTVNLKEPKKYHMNPAENCQQLGTCPRQTKNLQELTENHLLAMRDLLAFSEEQTPLTLVRLELVRAMCADLTSRLEIRRTSARRWLRLCSWLGSSWTPRRLVWDWARIDAAAKGAYIVTRELDTISRLVAKVRDEVDHLRVLARFVSVRLGKRLIEAVREVARQVTRSERSFSEQLDELEEHLYLSFLTINRARKLLAKKIDKKCRTDY
ncbi:hypothetical protein AMTRI_Chr07g30040 [Amborella trichopoda]